MKARHPVHVTMRLREGLPSLRRESLARVVIEAFDAAKARFGVRLVHFSVQSNHLHVIVEVAEHAALARAMQGLAIRVARGLNRHIGRRGAVFAERYHARALRTPLEVRRALVYVLRNNQHHTKGFGRPCRFDPLSSAPYFDGFTTRAYLPRNGFVPKKEPTVASAATWLLRVGWRRLGLVRPEEAPVRRHSEKMAGATTANQTTSRSTAAS
jgi:REP element-mobilizing transposase RayT